MSEERRRYGGLEAWHVGWDDVREAALDSALAATPAQRLAWLEEAIELAYRAGALRREPRKTGSE